MQYFVNILKSRGKKDQNLRTLLDSRISVYVLNFFFSNLCYIYLKLIVFVFYKKDFYYILIYNFKIYIVKVVFFFFCTLDYFNILLFWLRVLGFILIYYILSYVLKSLLEYFEFVLHIFMYTLCILALKISIN